MKNKAEQVFDTLGRTNKLLLARRDQHAVRRFLENLDADVRAQVLTRCGKFAAGVRRRG